MGVAKGSRPAPQPEDLMGGEYSPIALRPSWGLVSMVAALLSLSASQWAWYLPINVPWHLRPLIAPTATLCLAVVGLAIAWPLRRRSGVARAAFFINGIICALLSLMVLAFVAWRLLR